MIDSLKAKIAYYFHIHGQEVAHGMEMPVLLFMEYPALMQDLLQKPTLHCGDIKAKFSISHNGFYVAILSDDQDKEAMAMIDELVSAEIAPEKVSPEHWRERIDMLVDTLAISTAANWQNIKEFHKFHCENDASDY